MTSLKFSRLPLQSWGWKKVLGVPLTSPTTEVSPRVDYLGPGNRVYAIKNFWLLKIRQHCGVPRKNPLSPRERGICARLKQARLHSKLSRVAFCSELSATTGRHIDATTFANYELAKARVPYWVANAACKRFAVSQAWLAEGLGPQHYGTHYSPGLDAGEERAPFSFVYDKHFKMFRELIAAFLPGAPRPPKRRLSAREQALMDAEYAAMKKESLELISAAFDSANETQKIDLIDRIHLMMREFSAAHQTAAKSIPFPDSSQKKK